MEVHRFVEGYAEVHRGLKRCMEVCRGYTEVGRGSQRGVVRLSPQLIRLCRGVSLQLIRLHRGVHGGLWRGAWRGVHRFVEECVEVCRGLQRGTWRGVQRYMEVCRGVCKGVQRFAGMHRGLQGVHGGTQRCHFN